MESIRNGCFLLFLLGGRQWWWYFYFVHGVPKNLRSTLLRQVYYQLPISNSPPHGWKRSALNNLHKVLKRQNHARTQNPSRGLRIHFSDTIIMVTEQEPVEISHPPHFLQEKNLPHLSRRQQLLEASLWSCRETGKAARFLLPCPL